MIRTRRDIGVRVALDDFGTGYSSLAHLRMFRFDKIKIDGSFVKDAVGNPDCAAVVRAVADIGKQFGATTVAESVETQAEFDRVRHEGCDEVQGYLVGKPTPDGRDAARASRHDSGAFSGMWFGTAGGTGCGAARPGTSRFHFPDSAGVTGEERKPQRPKSNVDAA